MTSHAPHGQAPLSTVQVLGTGRGGVGEQVGTLAAGLVARGVRVTVCAPAESARAYGLTETGARHVPVPRRADPAGVAALRTACTGADLVHAHGLHAGLRAALALRGRRTPLVVTWPAHRQPSARPALRRMLERRVARAATVVLGASPAVVDRARARGARDARLAAPRPGGALPERKKRAELGAVGRPLLVTTEALELDRGHDVLLDAARRWRDLDPAPLLVVAGEGALRSRLQHRIDTEHLEVRLLGRRDDVPALLAAADVVVLPAGAAGEPDAVRAALDAGVPLVAADRGGHPDLAGDAAVRVPYGAADALATAVVQLLADPARGRPSAAPGGRGTTGGPTEDGAVAQVLSLYDELTQPLPGWPR